MEQISCDVAKRMILNYVDGEIEGLQKAYLKSHIKTCPSCHRRYRVLRQVRDLLHDSFAAFRPNADLTKDLIGKLPDKYPLEGFDPSTIRNLGLAGKERIYAAAKAPLTSRQLWIWAGAFAAALLLMALLLYPVVKDPIRVLFGKPPEIREEPVGAPFRSMAPAVGVQTATGNFNGVFELADGAGFGILYNHSVIEKERSTDIGLHRGELFIDGRRSTRRIRIRIGSERPGRFMADRRRLVDTMSAQVIVRWHPDEIHAGGRLSITVFDGEVSVDGRTLPRGTRFEIGLDGNAVSTPATDRLAEFERASMPETDIGQILTALDDQSASRRNEIQDRLGALANAIRH